MGIPRLSLYLAWRALFFDFQQHLEMFMPKVLVGLAAVSLVLVVAENVVPNVNDLGVCKAKADCSKSAIGKYCLITKLTKTGVCTTKKLCDAGAKNPGMECKSSSQKATFGVLAVFVSLMAARFM